MNFEGHIFMALMPVHTKKNNGSCVTAMRMCITAGGKVIGCVEDGWNVAAIESDEEQHLAFREQLSMFDAVRALRAPNPISDGDVDDKTDSMTKVPSQEECAVCGLVATAAMVTCGLCADKKCVGCRPNENCVRCHNSKAEKDPDGSSEKGKSPENSDKKSDDEGEIKIC